MKIPNDVVGESIMCNTRKFLQTTILALGSLVLPMAAASAQPQKTVFCISDGTQIGVDRFEMKEGKFFLYVQGSADPLQYPATSVKGIDVPCTYVPAAAAAPALTPAPASAPTIAHFGIAGSNTIGERLMPMLIDAFGSKRLGMEPQSKITGKEEQEITLRSSSGTQAVINFAAHGSGTATPGLVEGKAVIGMASRALNDAETKLIDERFKVPIRAAGNEHVLALDGIAVIVHPENPVKLLTLEQIAKVFSGQIANWKDVGGADRPIHVLRRNNDSGTYDTFNTLVLSPLKLQMSPQAAQYESSETLSSDVSKDADAVGFIALPYINKNRAVVIGSSCGITGSPSAFTVKNEQYPLARRLYLYTLGTPKESAANDLLKFALSDEAQPTIEDAEFIDQRVALQDEQDQRNWSVSVSANPEQGLPGGQAGAARRDRRLHAVRLRGAALVGRVPLRKRLLAARHPRGPGRRTAGAVHLGDGWQQTVLDRRLHRCRRRLGGEPEARKAARRAGGWRVDEGRRPCASPEHPQPILHGPDGVQRHRRRQGQEPAGRGVARKMNRGALLTPCGSSPNPSWCRA
jgi:phosphate transport system substrate-binding protein